MTKPTTVEEYYEALDEARQEAMFELRDTICENLPNGFNEVLNHGIPSWVVPHAIYGPGYHVNPDLPLPFLSIASQKSHVALYHMGIYASASLMDWLVESYPRHSKIKLDMGKSCIRFKKVTNIPYDLIGELCTKMGVEQWIALYEEQFL